MAEVNDDTDFNKARGFLLTYSGIVLALWFFGAKLTEFKLMGTEIHLEHRTNSVWMVLGWLNVYFWFRCYQRLPEGALRFDDRMHEILDKTLENIGRVLFYRKAFALAEEQISKWTEPSSPTKLLRIHLDAKFSYLQEMEARAKHPGFTPKTRRDYGYPFRSKMLFRITTITSNGGGGAGGWSNEVNLAGWQYRLAILHSFMKGVFVHSWFTDHVAPLLAGILSTSVAFYLWWQVNYGSTSGIGL